MNLCERRRLDRRLLSCDWSELNFRSQAPCSRNGSQIPTFQTLMTEQVLSFKKS